MKLVDESDAILTHLTPLFDFDEPPVDPVAFSNEMHEAMISFSDGVGLAAPQVGYLYRVFVMNIGRPISCFNPEIIAVSEQTERGDEGCLSFPGLWLKIRRPIRVQALYQDAFGNLVNETFENLSARCYLHEYDHLNGIRFTDLVGPLTKRRALDRRLKSK